MRTLWSEIPADIKETLLERLEEWHIKALMRATCGKRVYVPKVGQLPYADIKPIARLRFRALRDEGYTYQRAIETTAHECRVSVRTVQSWVSHRQTQS